MKEKSIKPVIDSGAFNEVCLPAREGYVTLGDLVLAVGVRSAQSVSAIARVALLTAIRLKPKL